MPIFHRSKASRPPREGVSPRLVTMLMMLVVVALVMWQAGDPANWRWLELLSDQTPVTSATEPVPAPVSATVETSSAEQNPVVAFEEDPLELAAAEEQFMAITDGTTKLAPEEMPAYWRLFNWVEQQSLAQMRKRARTKVVLNDFVQTADEQRGKLFALELNVRRVLAYDAPENSAGIKTVYEVWGATNESRAWPYVIVTAHLPPGMPTGPNVHEQASFAGYFFKVQGYQAAGAGPQDRPLIAPLLVGRLSRHAAPVPVQETAWSPWIIGLVLTGIVWLALRILVGRWRKKRSTAPLPSAIGSSPNGLVLSGWLAPGADQFDRPPHNSKGNHDHS